MLFKSGFAAIAAVAVMSTGAMAASHHHAMPAPAAPAESAWNGLYVGATAGAGQTSFLDTEDIALSSNNLYGGIVTGESVGAEIGYDTHLTDRIVAGVVADISDRIGTAPIGTEASWAIGLTWDASVRARLGLDMGSWMPYVTAGYAMGSMIYNEPPRDTTTELSGWTVGAGVEMVIAQHVTAKIEYRHTDFGSPVFDGYPIQTSDDSVRVGIDYHF